MSHIRDDLTLAINRDDIERVRALLNDLNVNMENISGNTPLMEAVDSGSRRIVSLLLATPGVNINYRSTLHLETAFLKAVFQQDPNMVHLFLADARLDVNAIDGYGFTPLMKAIGSDNLAIVQALLADPRVDVQYRHPSTGQTALHLSTWYGQLPESEALLADPRMNVNAIDLDWETPLMNIVRRRLRTLLPMILRKPALDIYIKNRHGFNAIDLALKNGDTEMAEAILKKRMPHELFNRQLTGRSYKQF